MNLKTTLAIAVLIRLILIPFFYHPDMKSQYFHFQFLTAGHFDIYSFIADHKTALPYKDTFNYLPLTYFTFGSFYSIIKPISPFDLSNWLNDWSATQNIYSNLPYFLLLLKIPYLLLDILIALLLYKISASNKILYIWLFNPVSFYLIYILGNFDILPVFLTLLSYYLLPKKTVLSLLLFGLAISLKLYPLLFLPLYLFLISKNIFQIIKNSIIALLPLVLTILPFINNPYFWQSFFGSGLTQKIIEIKFFHLPLFPLIYTILIIVAYLSKKLSLPKYVFYIFLLFVSTVNFHPQWLLWFLPFIFLLPEFISHKFLFLILLYFSCILTYILLINDHYLSWGHLVPIDPEFISLTTPYDFVRYKLLLNPLIIQQNIKLILAGFSILFFSINEKFNFHSRS